MGGGFVCGGVFWGGGISSVDSRSDGSDRWGRSSTGLRLSSLWRSAVAGPVSTMSQSVVREHSAYKVLHQRRSGSDSVFTPPAILCLLCSGPSRRRLECEAVGHGVPERPPLPSAAAAHGHASRAFRGEHRADRRPRQAGASMPSVAAIVRKRQSITVSASGMP